jgi:RNA polymerase sigma factor (sigma-70 family)
MRALAGAAAPDLDDLVQLAAEQTFRSLATFAGDSELKTWISGVCYRVLLGQRRWYRRFAARFLVGHDANASCPRPSPAMLVERRERIVALRAAVSKMSDKYRAVVVLHDFEELDIEEVATVVGANSLTIRSRLRDGRKQLKRLLADDPEWSWEGFDDEDER